MQGKRISKAEKDINSDLTFLLTLPLQPPSPREVSAACFLRLTEGVLLCLARKPRQTESAAKAAGEPKVNSPSVSAEKHRRASSLTEGAFKGKVKS